MVTHPGARYAGPAWLLVGLGRLLGDALVERPGLLDDVDPTRGAADGRGVLGGSSCR